jgi:hypothetical protein
MFVLNRFINKKKGHVCQIKTDNGKINFSAKNKNLPKHKSTTNVIL